MGWVPSVGGCDMRSGSVCVVGGGRGRRPVPSSVGVPPVERRRPAPRPPPGWFRSVPGSRRPAAGHTWAGGMPLPFADGSGSRLGRAGRGRCVPHGPWPGGASPGGRAGGPPPAAAPNPGSPGGGKRRRPRSVPPVPAVSLASLPGGRRGPGGAGHGLPPAVRRRGRPRAPALRSRLWVLRHPETTNPEPPLRTCDTRPGPRGVAAGAWSASPGPGRSCPAPGVGRAVLRSPSAVPRALRPVSPAPPLSRFRLVHFRGAINAGNAGISGLPGRFPQSRPGCPRRFPRHPLHLVASQG